MFVRRLNNKTGIVIKKRHVRGIKQEKISIVIDIAFTWKESSLMVKIKILWKITCKYNPLF